MGSTYGTVTKTGKAMTSQSKNARPATSGNKNINARRSPAGDPRSKTAGMVRRTHTGPYSRN